ncbi:MAG: hypothetical protein GOV00_03965, partial [Candidatus Altiarchaeota archaeon]|nr:hypothetical protein [Candidatus Altiarchaeota archaeon]
MTSLNQFIPEDDQKSKLANLFSRGVRMVYADALKLLMQDGELLEKVILSETLPPEITSKFLEELKRPITP